MVMIKVKIMLRKYSVSFASVGCVVTCSMKINAMKLRVPVIPPYLVFTKIKLRIRSQIVFTLKFNLPG